MQELTLRAVCRLRRAIGRLAWTLIGLAATSFHYTMICLRPSRSLAAENLFLRKQLALFQERQTKPRRVDDTTRAALVWLSRACNWREALVVVKPETLIRWHREGFRLYWKIKSRPGRPALPGDLRALIRRMALENVAWGEERIADELLLKLGLRVSPRTVRKYMPARTDDGPEAWRSDQRWATFVRNHAEAIAGPQNAGSITEGERHLRADDWHDPPRMSGLSDPSRRASFIQDSCGMDWALQRGEAA